MWFVKNNKKTIDIYPVKEHICDYGKQGKIIKTYQVVDGSKYVLSIAIKNDNVKIDINHCPFCGKKL